MREYHRCKLTSLACNGIGIVGSYYVQNYGIVGRIGVVSMQMPIACAQMYFYVSAPTYAIYYDLCVEEIWSCVAIVTPLGENLYRATLGGSECFVQVGELCPQSM